MGGGGGGNIGFYMGVNLLYNNNLRIRTWVLRT